MRAGYGSEPVEGGEEFVTPRRHGRAGQKIAHRERINEAVIEHLIAHRVRDRARSGAAALHFCQRPVLEVDAKILLRGPGDEPLRVDGAGEMGVEVAAFWHAIWERAQRGVIVARGFESICG